MPGMTTANSAALTRSIIWSQQLKDRLIDDLFATQYVNWLSDFPDGNTFTIPSIGAATIRNYVENDAIQFDAMDTGEFTFSITEYTSSATYITKKNLQDGFYMSQLVASFVPEQHRALMERVETDVLNLSASQAANVNNAINGFDHRFVGTGLNETMAPADFARAKLSLKKANVPMSNLVAIVDPTVAYALETSANFINFSNNAKWEGIVADGLTSGMRFIKNIYGFDVYESNYLADANETILASTLGAAALTTTVGKANMFFSAESSVLPFVGAWRQMPEVETEYNMGFQREEYVTTSRYGVKLFRPENLICVLTDTDQV